LTFACWRVQSAITVKAHLPPGQHDALCGRPARWPLGLIVTMSFSVD
jgi:hypothetical protein